MNDRLAANCLITLPSQTLSGHPAFWVADIAPNDYFQYPLPKRPMYSLHYRAALLASGRAAGGRTIRDNRHRERTR